MESKETEVMTMDLTTSAVLEHEVIEPAFKPLPESEWIDAIEFSKRIRNIFDSSSDEFQLLPFQGPEDFEIEELMYKAYKPKEKITKEENLDAKVRLRQKLREMKAARTRVNLKNGVKNMSDR